MKKIVNKKAHTLALVLTASLLLSSFMLFSTISATMPESNPPKKSKIYGVPVSALISELGDDASILVSITTASGGIEKLEGYASLGRAIELPSEEFLVRAVTTPGNLGAIEAIEEVSSIWTKMKPVVPNISPVSPEFEEMPPETDMWITREVLGVNQAFTEFGVTGAGVRIAIVDTGVDYSHPDLIDALEYVTLPSGIREPLVLDSDESQVLLFKDFVAVGGKISTAGTIAQLYNPGLVQITVTVNYTVGTLSTASGVYKFAMTSLYGYSPSRFGVLLTDPTTAGVYDTAYVDLNGNADFTDDNVPGRMLTYGGDRVSRMPATGLPTRTVGVLGGFFYDTFYWFNPFFAGFMPGWDLSGKYLSLFYDFDGHGTSCSGNAASRGKTTFTISPFGSVKLLGIAPNATIVGVKALWYGNVEQAWLWAAGFDIDSTGKFYYTGSKRADMTSNSWGISSQVYDIFGFGYDLEAMLLNGLATPGFLDPAFPGIVMLKSGGNGGFGYGTITTPCAASMAITVGASTVYNATANLFGIHPYGKWDDVISWSARGPSPIGETKPDVTNNGAFAFTPHRTPYYYRSFSGTSQSCPLTAGVVALMLDGSNKAITNSQMIRTILQTSAKDQGYNSFVQGSGRVDAYTAVLLSKRLASQQPGGPSTFNVYTYETMKNLESILAQAWYLQWTQHIPGYLYAVGSNILSVPDPMIPKISTLPSGKVFLGRRKPGTANEFKLFIENPNAEDAEIISSKALKYEKIGHDTYTGVLKIRAVGLPPTFGDRVDFLFNPSVFTGSLLTRFNLFADFTDVDPGFDYTWDYRTRLWVFEWIDDNGNTLVEDSELRMFNYGYVTGATQEVPVTDIVGRLSSANSQILVRVDGTKWAAATPGRSIPFTLVVTKYARTEDSIMTLAPESKNLPAGSTVKINGVLHVPTTATGVQEGLIQIEVQTSAGVFTKVLPYSYVAVVPASGTITPPPSNEGVLYDLGAVRGALDWRWRYESGDWRVFAVEVPPNPNVFALEVTFKWTDYNSTLDVFTIGPDGQFAGLYSGTGLPFSYVVPGSVSGNYRFRWHSVYDRTGTALLQHTSFPQTRYIINQYGFRHYAGPAVFTIYIHQVLHAGKRLSEPIIGTVRQLTTSKRLQLVVPLGGSEIKRLDTSVTMPYEVAISPGSPAPSDTTSLIFDGATSGPLTFTPTLPVSYATSFPANTEISTEMIDLRIGGSVTESYAAATLIKTTLPDLRVFVRTTGTTVTQLSAPLYTFQDWTAVGFIGKGKSPT